MYRSFVSCLILLGAAGPLAAADIDSQGFIQHWLLLGPYTQAGGAAPGDVAIRGDYLTDGTVTQTTIAPFPDLAVNTNYGIAASDGLAPTPNNPALNPGGTPRWFDYTAPADTIDFDAIHGSDIDNIMMHACCYVENKTGAPISNVQAACASDDSIQVIVGTSEVHIHSIGRAISAAGTTQDVSSAFTLPAGVTRLMVKIFEGGGQFAFRLRLQDGSGPLLENKIGITVIPFGPCPTSVAVYPDSWLREVTLAWENRYSSVEIWESGAQLVRSTDTTLRSLTLSDVAIGQHRYEFRSKVGEDKPACTAVIALTELVPVWPTSFACAYDQLQGTIDFTWHNREPYYEVLKITRGGSDVLGLTYGTEESAQLASSLAPGTYTFELVAELGGYASSAMTCQVEVTGPPPEFKRGDANADGAVNVADAVFTLGHLFVGGPAPSCLDAGDANDDGTIDISDAVASLRYVFAGRAIPLPGPTACGPDPTTDGLSQCDYNPEDC